MIQAWGEHPLPRPHMLFIKIFWDYFLPLLYLMDWSMLKILGSVGTNFFMIIALELLLRTCNLGKGYSPPALVSLGFSEREQGSSAFVFLRGRRSQHCCLHLTSHRIDCTAPSMRVLYPLHIVYFLLVKKKRQQERESLDDSLAQQWPHTQGRGRYPCCVGSQASWICSFSNYSKC